MIIIIIYIYIYTYNNLHRCWNIHDVIDPIMSSTGWASTTGSTWLSPPSFLIRPAAPEKKWGVKTSSSSYPLVN